MKKNNVRQILAVDDKNDSSMGSSKNDRKVVLFGSWIDPNQVRAEQKIDNLKATLKSQKDAEIQAFVYK